MENDNGETAREDLGYRNTPGTTRKYQINKELRMSRGSNSSPAEPSALCRIRLANGEIKRAAWEYAEFLINQRGAEFMEWINA